MSSWTKTNETDMTHQAVWDIVQKMGQKQIKGDGAKWIQKDNSCECICILDKFHRNKKITECVSDKNIAETLRELLFENKFDKLLDCIEAYINSTEDEREKAKLE